MNILIAALSGATSPDGVNRHTINLTRCLLQRSEIKRVDLVIGKWQAAFLLAMLNAIDTRLHIHEIDVAPSSVSRNAWYFARLPLLARALQSSIVHIAYPLPVRRTRFHCPVVVTLHDLYPVDVPRNFGYPRVYLSRLILRYCLKTADAIACVSQSTLARLAKYDPTLMTKAVCLYNSVEPFASSGSAPLTLLVERPFVLAVAQHRKNKNLPLTLHVFERLLLHLPSLLLCLTGREGPETSALLRQIEVSSLRRHVVMLHGISDQQLQWCYRHARLLLATSSVEGFGLSIAEAMLAGCPIACSDIPAHRELGADYAHLAPMNVDTLSTAARRALQQPRPHPVILPHLSSSRLSEKYIHLYRELLRLYPVSLQNGIALKGRAA